MSATTSLVKPATADTRRTAPGTRPILAFIRLYQALRAGRPSPCRFWPTCSAYAAEAVETHGAARGTWLALRRVARCHPWGGRGVDLVPEPMAAPGSEDRLNRSRGGRP